MSLQVWLPLTGHTNNQGVDGSTIIGSPASGENGKIGKCANFNGAVANVLHNDSGNWNYTDNFSGCVWINPNYTGTAAQYAFTVGRADAGSYGYGLQITSASIVRFKFGNVNSDISVPSGSGTHLAYTKSGTTMKIYKNGVLTETKTFSGTLPTYTESKGLGVGCFHYSGGDIYPFYGKMNDFRIYDHCLSPKEVKEISKGLCLHYKLDGASQGGNPNLYKGTYTMSGPGSTGSGTTSAEKYNGFSVKEKSSAGGGLAQNIPCAQNDIFTISFGAKVEAGGVICSIHRSNLGNVTTGLTILDGNFIDNSTNWVRASDDGTQGKRYWATVKITGSDVTYLQGRIENSNAIKMSIAGLKLEKGSVATSGCPNAADAEYVTMGYNDSTFIEDVSGYGYHGEKTAGTIISSSDSARYEASSLFSIDSYISHPILFPMYHATYSLGVKASSYSGYGMIYGQKNNPSGGNVPGIAVNTENTKAGAYFGSNSPNYTKSASGTLSSSVWHHLAYVGNNGVAQGYIDGVASGNPVTYTTSYIANAQRGAIGDSYAGTSWGGTPFNGNISDFRIYTTALSADDILELYEVGASIDNKGNFYSYELKEI